MFKKLLAATFLIIFLTQPAVQIAGGETVKSETLTQKVDSKQMDKNAKILADYLASYNSPLQYSAQDFIDAAKEYNLDWKLVVAISGVESTFGKFIPGGYNGWGWGAYDAYHAVYFYSWREAIFAVSKGLRENYINKGLTEPYAINRAYAVSPYWGGKVAYFMNDLEKYAQKYDSGKLISGVFEPQAKVAAVSGLLALDRL